MQLSQRGSVPCDHNARNHDRDYSRRVQDVGHEVAAVGDRHRREDLERCVLGEPEQCQAQKPHCQPHDSAARGEHDEPKARIAGGGRAADDGAKHSREHGHTGAVVEQALAFQD